MRGVLINVGFCSGRKKGGRMNLVVAMQRGWGGGGGVNRPNIMFFESFSRFSKLIFFTLTRNYIDGLEIPLLRGSYI